jgi:photosystem II stability/assembly factor-like uncharacterized protein
MASSHRRLVFALGCASLLTACSTGNDAPHAVARPHVSGAYSALSFWGDSRAYPARDIPPHAFTEAYEFSRANLRRSLVGAFGRSRGMEDGATAPLATGQGGGWQAIGPRNGGGRTLTLAFDPNDPSTVYAGAASGGLWRSTTGGVGAAAWQRVTTGFPELGVSTIAFEPGSSDVFYIGTGEVYNYQTAGDLEADRRTRGSYGIGILKTTDGGATWTKSLDWSYNQRHGVWAIRIDSTDNDVVWAATTEGVYKSLDAGQTWTQKHAVVMAMDLVLHPTNPQIALVGCGDLSSPGRGIYRTTDGGDSWTQITGGGVPTDFAGKIQFGVTPADPDLVFASIGNGFEVFGPDNYTWLLRSTDFGASFALRSTTDYSRWQGWYSHDVAVHPTDPDTIVTVGIDIWKSTDGGLNLAQVSDYNNYFRGVLAPGDPEGLSDYSHADHHDVLYHPTDPDIVYFANDGGVFRSLDGGKKFEGVNGGYQSQQFYNGFSSDPTNPNLAMGGLQDFSSAVYRGPGLWQRWVYGGDGGWSAIDHTNPDVLYATAQFLSLAKSFDGGASFTDISPPDLGGPVAFIAPFVMSPTDAQLLYAGSNYLFKSFDGGAVWYIGQGGTEIDGNPLLVFAVAQNDDVLYLASAPHDGNRGRVHRTTDGGSTFTDLTGTLPDRYPGDMTVDPTDEATVYLTLSGFGSSHVFKSTDYGTTWTDIDGGRLPDVPTTAVVVDPVFPDHVYVGNDIGVYFTADAGATWVQLDLGLPEAVLIGDLSISPSNRVLRAATHGQGVYERALLGGNDAGAVPDGDAVPGVPLTMTRLGNGDLTLSWDASCLSNDDDFAIYEGLLGDFTSHVPLFCSTGGETSKTLTPSSGDRYYLVVPRNFDREGSYGVESGGAERPPSVSACLTQQFGACPAP